MIWRLLLPRYSVPGRLDDVFRRLLKVGVRLNAQRDPQRLPRQIVDEVSELTGAERIALVLLDAEGKNARHRNPAALSPLPGDERNSGSAARSTGFPG
jgi:hypothetical protein